MAFWFFVFTQYAIAIFVEPVKTILRGLNKFGSINYAVVIRVSVMSLAPRLMMSPHFVTGNGAVSIRISLGNHLRATFRNFSSGNGTVAIHVKTVETITAMTFRNGGAGN